VRREELSHERPEAAMACQAGTQLVVKDNCPVLGDEGVEGG